jgi:hypothetical protein
MPTNYHAVKARGQQRDKLYREALRMELAAMGDGDALKKLREMAKVHIEVAVGGDLQAIRDIRDTLDGRPTQRLEHEVPENGGITKVVFEVQHLQVPELPDTETIEGQCEELPKALPKRNGAGNGSGNGHG